MIQNKVLWFNGVLVVRGSQLCNNNALVFYLDSSFVDLEFEPLIRLRNHIIPKLLIPQRNILNLTELPVIVQINNRHLEVIPLFQPHRKLPFPLVDLPDDIRDLGLLVISSEQVNPFVVLFGPELDQELVLVLVVKVSDLAALVVVGGAETFDGFVLEQEVVDYLEFCWVLEGFCQVGV